MSEPEAQRNAAHANSHLVRTRRPSSGKRNASDNNYNCNLLLMLQLRAPLGTSGWSQRISATIADPKLSLPPSSLGMVLELMCQTWRW